MKKAWKLCVIASVGFTIQRLVVTCYWLEGASNEPTFADGDIILVGVTHLLIIWKNISRDKLTSGCQDIYHYFQ